MKFKNKIPKYAVLFVAIGLAFSACQKLTRPELKELILDPPPPPYSILKSYWSFDNNARDTGQYRAVTIAKNVTYAAGVAGQAAKFGTDGYVLVSSVDDSLKTLGSFTVAFWMNGVGPVTGGAQGVFAISNSTQFWGNLEMFLENDNNGSEAYLKVHMFNSSASDGIGEQWNEVKIPNALNKWTHIALTYDAATSQITLFADGMPVSAIDHKVLDGGHYGPVTFKSVSGLVLGTYAFQVNPSLTNHGPETWARSFAGALDQFRIYNVAIPQSEVTNLYTNKL